MNRKHSIKMPRATRPTAGRALIEQEPRTRTSRALMAALPGGLAACDSLINRSIRCGEQSLYPLFDQLGSVELVEKHQAKKIKNKPQRE